MEGRIQHHGIDVIRPGGAEVRIGQVGEVAPAGEDFRGFGDDGLIVGRDRQAGGVELERAVRLELNQPHAEELHDLPREVLVGVGACDRIGLGVFQGGEVAAHDRAERHLFEQGPEIAEGVFRQDVPVVGRALGLTGVEAVVADDEDLTEGERHALAQLVRGEGNGLEPRPLLERLEVVVRAQIGVDRELVGELVEFGGAEVGCRYRDLGGDPGVDRRIDQAVDLRAHWTVGALGQQAGGVAGGHRGRVHRRRCGGRDKHLRAGGGEEGAPDLTGGIVGGVDADVDAARLDGVDDLRRRRCGRVVDVPLVARDLAERQVEHVVSRRGAVAQEEMRSGLPRTEIGETDIDRGERTVRAQNDAGQPAGDRAGGARGRPQGGDVERAGAVGDGHGGGGGGAERVAGAREQGDRDGFRALRRGVDIGLHFEHRTGRTRGQGDRPIEPEVVDAVGGAAAHTVVNEQ